jgi:gamma-glutamylcyclotransferase (GGCT)/AIG2-like uncharacterized protein YtfP
MENVFRLFVYGTLKEGGPHHHLLAGNVTPKLEAQVAGTLHHTEDGIPYIVVPKHTVLMAGTRQSASDSKKASVVSVTPTDSDSWVSGELYTILDPQSVVPLLDLLEDFEPNKESEYDRVLLPVNTGDGWVAAWAYIIHKNTPLTDS